MEYQLKDLVPGTTGEVVGYTGTDRNYRDRLLAMGLTKGTRFTVLRVAPLGDPIEIDVRGFSLSLRKEESNALEVRRIGE
jgi:ferrous iron transport protein A